MLVKNVQPRLIHIAGLAIVPGQIVEVDESAVGLDRFLLRGILVEVKAKAEQEIKGAEEAKAPQEAPQTPPKAAKKKEKDK